MCQFFYDLIVDTTPEPTLSKQSSEKRVCIQHNGKSTNWSTVKNMFFIELFLSSKNDTNFGWILHEFVLEGSICKKIHSFL